MGRTGEAGAPTGNERPRRTAAPAPDGPGPSCDATRAQCAEVSTIRAAGGRPDILTIAASDGTRARRASIRRCGLCWRVAAPRDPDALAAEPDGDGYSFEPGVVRGDVVSGHAIWVGSSATRQPGGRVVPDTVAARSTARNCTACWVTLERGRWSVPTREGELHEKAFEGDECAAVYLTGGGGAGASGGGSSMTAPTRKHRAPTRVPKLDSSAFHSSSLAGTT